MTYVTLKSSGGKDGLFSKMLGQLGIHEKTRILTPYSHPKQKSNSDTLQI